MPNLGADMEAGTLVEWKVKPGDRITRGDIIAEVEKAMGGIGAKKSSKTVLSICSATWTKSWGWRARKSTTGSSPR